MYSLSTSLRENINIIKESFQKDDTLIIREFQIQDNPPVVNLPYSLLMEW